MNSKAHFKQSSSTHGKGTKGGASSINNSGSKRAAAGNTVAASGFQGSTAKSGPVQVIFNGKIVTPQSLIPKKFGHHDGGKRSRPPLPKPQTIDETASEAIDRVAMPALGSKLGLKKNEPANESRLGSKLNVLNRNKVVVEETATVILRETTTQILLAIPSYIVASDTRDVIQTDERNARYEACVKAHHNVDGFNSRPTQTKNNPLKNQNEMAAPNAFREFGSQAISYEIQDEVAAVSSVMTEQDLTSGLGVGTDAIDDLNSLSAAVKRFVSDTVGVALVTPGCLLDTESAVRPLAPGEVANSSKAKPEKGGKGRSMMGVNQRQSTMNAASEAASGEDAAFGFGAPPGGGKNNKQVSTASSGNNSGQDISVPAPSGSKANISQSNAGDSTMDSEGEGGGKRYETFTEEDSQEILREHEIKTILSSPLLLKKLNMIERAIQQNANYRSQLDYRDLPDIAPLTLISPERAKLVESSDQLFGGGLGGIGGKSGLGMKRGFTDRSLKGVPHGLTSESSQLFSDTASVQSVDEHGNKKFDPSNVLNGESSKVKKLFSYSNPDLIGNRAVTSMAWNAVSSDLLAVGYGRSSDLQKNPDNAAETLNDEAQEGLVLFWSLRNPDFPEKILRTPHAVTALDFSKQHAMTLAVGLANGDVNVYDVKREGNWGTPIESSAGMPGSHMDPVWQVKWIIKGVERLETLVSISTDGRVLEWNLKKGLVMSTLMQLKKSGTGEGWISNSSAGLCFDFNPSDSTTYVTGTEDGSLYRCSVSYNEQYLETYQNHEAPVYKVKFSTRWPSVFLTCSADWSANLYHLSSKTPLLSMRATGENFPINDVCWCPGNSTVFACVTVDAKLQIWDLSVSSIDPVVVIDVGAEDLKLVEDLASEVPKSPNDPSMLEFPHTAATSPQLGASRFYDRFDNKDEVQMAPVAKLLKNLAVDPKKRMLTTVLFGEKNPILVVGDSKGVVSVYRVFDPITINHLGPLQQYTALKEAIIKQTDPAHAISLAQDNMVEEKQ